MADGRAPRRQLLAAWAVSSLLAATTWAQDTSRVATPPQATVARDSGTVVSPPGGTTPQTAADYIAAGDKDYTAMKAPAALSDYEHAVGLDSNNYEALYKAARSAVDLGEFEPNAQTKRHDFDNGLRLARRAVAVNPSGADGHFHAARALGREALSVGVKKRIQFAKEVRAQALAALAIDSTHPGALHVMGVWNAEIMRLSGIERFIARNLLGGGIFGTASWKDAVRYMEESVAVDPKRIVHHLDLGKIYADVGEKAKAREQFEIVINAPAAEYNDPHYKQDAQDRLGRL
jgi:tetratricopeptide (TPR) repeat protein